MIEIKKTSQKEIYDQLGFPESSVAMAAVESGEVLGGGAVTICDGYAVLENIVMKDEYKMFNLEFGIGKSLLNMLDLSGVRYVCSNLADERLMTSLRFKTDAEFPDGVMPKENYKYFLCLDGYFTGEHCS